MLGDLVLAIAPVIAGLAMLAFAGVAVWLGLRPASRMAVILPTRRWLVLVTASIALWCGAWFITGPGSIPTLVATPLRDLALLGWLANCFRSEEPELRRRSIRIIYLTLVCINVIGATLGIAALASIAFVGFSASAGPMFPGLGIIGMLTASGGLLLVDHCVRHRSEGQRMVVLVLAGACAALWAYDLNIALIGALAGRPALTLIMLEPAVALILLPPFVLVAMDTGREQIRLSRSIAFRTIAIMGVAAYLMVIALTGAAARMLGGDYGQLAQGAFLLIALGLGGLFFASARARAWLSVMISKHFFEHRYDYRAEWMRFTATISRSADDGGELFRRVARALAELTGSPAAIILTPDAQGDFRISDDWQWATSRGGDDLVPMQTAVLIQNCAKIIDLDALRAGDDDACYDFSVPPWLLADGHAWVVVPLLHFGRMVGIAVLRHPPTARELDWEDLDVLRIAGKQAASYVAEMQGQEALSEARRFDEFNRRFAFIMHDVKNLASQLGLLATNAERHAENPEFRADMVETLKFSVARMNELLHRLAPHSAPQTGPSVAVSSKAILDALVREAKWRHPVTVAMSDDEMMLADPQQVTQILAHLIANAIDASAADTPVQVAGSRDGKMVRIDVSDQGTGMSGEFIRTQLFKPFASTKGHGFGLGAFEALRLAKAMGGRIAVESQPGQGSQFTLWMPLADSPAATAADEAFDERKDQAA